MKPVVIFQPASNLFLRRSKVIAFAKPASAPRRRRRRQREQQHACAIDKGGKCKECGQQFVQCQAFNGNRCTICGSYMDECGTCNYMHEFGRWYFH